MRRREFITALGGAAAWPMTARAEQKASKTIGVLFSGGRSFIIAAGYTSAIQDGLGETGHREGSNLRIEYRWADGDYERLPSLVSDLVREQVALIIVSPTPAALAAKPAAKSIPIVFQTGGDPVKLGLTTSLNRPDGNMTGITSFAAVLNEKRLELLHQIVPAAKIVGTLVNSNNPAIAESTVKEVQSAAHRLGLQIEAVRARTADEINAAFDQLAKRDIRALTVSADGFFISRRDQIAELATRHAIAAVYEGRDYATAGGLLSYGSSNLAVFRQVGAYAGRILNGTKPSDLPIVQPAKFELVINLKTARALGLTVPDKLLALADEVIE